MTSRRPVLAVFFVAQALYLATAGGWPWRAPDEFETYFQTQSLVEHGTLAVDEPELGGAFFGVVGNDGKRYAPYGPAVAFVAAPYYFLARLRTDDLHARAGLTTLAAATAGALAVAGFFRAARKKTKESHALALAGALAVSVLWPYSKSFFSEAFSAAALIWAYVFIAEKRIAWASALLGLACLFKATNAVFALPLALAFKERKWLVLGVVAAGLVHIQWNTHRFGTPFELGYNWNETLQPDPRHPLSPVKALPFGGSLIRGIFILVASPGKSIFVWAPCLILALPHMKKEPAVALTGAVGLLVFAKYMFPEGGYCHGPRHLVPIVPLLLLPAAHASSRKGLVPLLLLGLAMNGLAASTSYLEDQFMGEDLSRQVYYLVDHGVEPGLPFNVYRLGYLPQVSLVETLLARHAGPGVGPDFFFRHFAGPVGLLPLFLAIVSLAAAGLASGKPLLRKENAAILPSGSPP
jgi:hypothetical protein